MEVEFNDDELDALEVDPKTTGDFSPAIVKAFRRRMQQIRAARDERDFYALKSLHFEKLSGQRQDEYSMRLNDQYRLVIRLEGLSPNKVVKVIGIEDYH
jgi:proteic killer suppression protein